MIWDLHTVRILPNGQTQLFIGRHLIHEVTSPQAFDMLRKRNLKVRHPELTVATVDHIVPTDGLPRPFKEAIAEQMAQVLEDNCAQNGITFFGKGNPRQGVVHIIGPEQGLTQPGMTVACGDSHTSTHGAFGAIAFGIGTTQVANVLATQCLLLERPLVRKIIVNGNLGLGVTAKDIILTIIRMLGVNGGVGYAYEYAGSAIEALSMEERMTLCNMSIEGGATCGYVNPDQKTVDYMKGRHAVPEGKGFDELANWWLSLPSEDDAEYDDIVKIDAEMIEPMITWGITPAQAIGINEVIPVDADKDAIAYMQNFPGQQFKGTKINVAFIGSCTNGRIEDLRAAAEIAKLGQVAPHVRALVVPGSENVRRQAVEEGLDLIFRAAGFDFRDAGCSMCLAMNPDKLIGDELCASSSNRNFMGRQGSPTGRTVLMSPAMVAAAAIVGEITDVRDFNQQEAA